MSLGNVVADRLERVAVGGFDIFKISKEAFSIYQDPGLSLTKDLDMALLSLIAMEEGPGSMGSVSLMLRVKRFSLLLDLRRPAWPAYPASIFPAAPSM